MDLAQKFENTIDNKSDTINGNEVDDIQLLITQHDSSNLTNKPQKPAKYVCEPCNYITHNKTDYHRHKSTVKHLSLIDPDKQLDPKIFECKCGKVYKHQSSLCGHKRTCSIIKPHNGGMDIGNVNTETSTIPASELTNSFVSNTSPTTSHNNDMIYELLKEICFSNAETNKKNIELHTQNIELQTQMIEYMKSK